ncbi:MAG: hypothetical protein IQL11_17240 [Bacteroidales bacterium]|nr:hypothetical protein [Bacteroidales bacterium]
MKAKSIFILLITLVVGFVLGMLTSAQIRFQRLRPVRMYFSEERFREGFYNMIQPDEKQKAEIEKILSKYAKLNSEVQSNFRKELETNMKEFRKEIDSKLTKEQLARIKEMDERRQEMIRQGRRNRDNDSLNNRSFGRGNRDRRPDGQRRTYPGDHPPDPGVPPPPPPPRDTVSTRL